MKTYVVAANVAWVSDDDVGVQHPESACLVAAIPHGPPVMLTGSASTIWRAVTLGGSLGNICEAVASTITDSPFGLEAGIESFLDDLVARGLVVAAYS